MKKKIVVERCEDCPKTCYNAPRNCLLPDDREAELEAENARLKAVVEAQAETIRLMTKKQAALADRAKKKRRLAGVKQERWTEEELEAAKAEGKRLAKLFMQDDAAGVKP